MQKIEISKSFFTANRKELVKDFKKSSISIITSNDEVFRNGDQTYPFRQSSELFYLTGLEQEKCILVLCPDFPDKNLREILFTIKPNELIETWTGHKYTKEEIQEISGVQTVKWLEDFEMTVRDLAIQSENIYVNLNEYSKYKTNLLYQDYRMVNDLKEKFPAHNFLRLAPLLTNQRLVKKPEEILLLQKACEITNNAFAKVLSFLEPGKTEYEIEAEITYEFIKQGARGHAYQPIIGTGKNSLILHYLNNSDTCQNGDLLLMDFGAEYANYAADCSRTIPVNGQFSERQKACYEAVLKVQKEAIKLYTPGNTIEIVNNSVFKMMEEEMIELGLFTKEEVKNQDPDQPLYAQYLMHGVAHFIGLDVHDVGSKYQKFKKGMVLTCEPGLYIKEENIGIRIENDILVDNVPVDLMAHIPREVYEIEEQMK